MERLEAVLSLVESCGIFCDVGCDHGYLSKAVLDSGLAGHIIASDISEKCLSKARELLGASCDIEFLVSDGFKSYTKKGDIAAICGMGGDTMIGILSRGGDFTPDTLILSPQSAAAKLRKYLLDNGYKITHDFVAKETERYYDIIKAVKYGEGSAQDADRLSLLYGMFYKIGSDTLKSKLVRLKEKLSLNKGTDIVDKKLDDIEEILKWQR